MNPNLIIPAPKECIYGRRYLLFQLIFLGSFLSMALALLNIRPTVLTLNLLYFAVNFIVVVLLCRKFLARSLRYGLGHLAHSLATAALGFAAYQLLMWLEGMLIVTVEPDFANVNDQNLANIGQENYPLMVIGTVLLVPLTEEVLYRGIVFGSLYRRNRVAAYLVSIAVFALVHISGYFGTVEPVILLLCFLQYIPAGICLAIAYEYSGSLLAPVLIHTTVNAIGMIAMR